MEQLNIQELIQQLRRMDDMRTARDTDAILETTSLVLQELGFLNVESEEHAFLWAYSVFAQVWALEQTEHFKEALVKVDQLLDRSFFKPHDSICPLGLPKLPPLATVHPLDGLNRPVLMKWRNRLQGLLKLEEKSQSDRTKKIKLDLQPAILYRIQAGDIFLERRHALKLVVNCFLSSELGLVRSEDFSAGSFSICCDVVLDPFGDTLNIGSGRHVVNSRGKCELEAWIQISTISQSKYLIWLRFSSNNPLVLPLLIGPIKIEPSWSTLRTKISESFDVIRPVNIDCVDGVQKTLYIYEQSDSGIYGRTWDSAFYFIACLPKLLKLLKVPASRSMEIMDLGCGVGTAGLGAALAFSNHCNVTLTDLKEALSIAEKNKHLLSQKYPEQASRVNIGDLLWGDSDAAERYGKQSVIIASDVVYEVECFDQLLDTFLDLSTHGTELWLVYKKRGLEQDEEDAFFSKLLKHFDRLPLVIPPSPWTTLGCCLYRMQRRELINAV
ncbi:hypothetical protein HDU67_006281 [Dinochytrium kinnereticum]|nr:hypothetical protein HDU67_006281 [Dinochytrium kinnereticum]